MSTSITITAPESGTPLWSEASAKKLKVLFNKPMTKNIYWARRGGYECSSKGDARFSAFRAVMPDGRSIEQHYQCDVKGYDLGGTNWRLGKGKPPLDRTKDMWAEYLKLWQVWAESHQILLSELREHAEAHNNTLTDMFASTPINQAHALAEILNQGE